MTASLSLPVWGEWIEMDDFGRVVETYNGSLPVWGEWIEMTAPFPYWRDAVRVSPRVGRVD